MRYLLNAGVGTALLVLSGCATTIGPESRDSYDGEIARLENSTAATIVLPLPEWLVLTADVELRNRPVDSGSVLRQLDAGATVKLASSADNASGFWVFVRTEDDQQGWIRMELVTAESALGTAAQQSGFLKVDQQQRNRCGRNAGNAAGVRHGLRAVLD
jgi:hypothetical protein